MRHAPRAPGGTILITGGGGTLATAFARVCASRGLECEILSRSALDVTDARAVSRALDRVRPWAVINAAGYVRVDDAEADQDRCREVNTRAAQQLAETCARRGIRLLCFSSDLVFGGRATRPCLESDPVMPLSAYGRSKADGDIAVLAAYPEALIARTSAFFGPWDCANVVYRAAEAFAAGHTWRAAHDQRVSPTYVPDLANVSIDLLIDGAAGIWHLANDGNVSWSELARLTAATLGFPDHLVDECSTLALELAAERPAYSVLGTERGQRLPSLQDALRRFGAERLPTSAPKPARQQRPPHPGAAA